MTSGYKGGTAGKAPVPLGRGFLLMIFTELENDGNRTTQS